MHVHENDKHLQNILCKQFEYIHVKVQSATVSVGIHTVNVTHIHNA